MWFSGFHIQSDAMDRGAHPWEHLRIPPSRLGVNVPAPSFLCILVLVPGALSHLTFGT